MLRNVHEQQFSAGEVIYTGDDDANFLCLLDQGSVELVSPTSKRIAIESTRFGEEATDVSPYLSRAIALTDVVVYAIPKEIPQVMPDSSSLICGCRCWPNMESSCPRSVRLSRGCRTTTTPVCPVRALIELPPTKKIA
ncbi:MAG: hypothetical protein A3H32_08145 [Betaproteobacteria bacterium RIFCSPLOWO2_02_FULL_63_19]|nr:MAG: hypothetical protein A3H32_08145 [Betaproteobacteria bacterium RIFCSPLOWO2_02_FULL_63_19]